jgi:hypothetical protein
MRRFSFGFVILAFPAFVLSIMLAGCGNKDTKSSGGGGGDKSGVDTDMAAQQKELKVLEPGKGVLKGAITLTSKPDVEALTKRFQDAIASKADQKENCMKGDPSEKTAQAYRIGSNGKLGNVFVWIQPASGTFFKVDEAALKAAKENPVKIRQPHCAFIPHSAIVWAEYHPDPKRPRDKKQTGQYIEVLNDSTFTSHNTKYEAGPGNPSGNETIPTSGKRKIENLVTSAKPMKLNCNIHTWMDGYIQLLDTPYYTISYSDTLDGKDKVEASDPKFGTYEIKNLPAGKMRVIVWHEECGYLNKNGGQGEEIEIAEGKPTEKNFEATPK